ncbi:hypothetical protein [Pleionea sediminis]|uniref:hypothetical protein n=1 Tax=Pleionea sediminis TaxID=2569479 RepID=UPI001184ABF9|nr:hypothetical protein [Pleionea sediminis]
MKFITLAFSILFAFGALPMMAKDNVAVQTKGKLCFYAKTDNVKGFVGVLASKSIRLHSTYRDVYCAPDGKFKGGSLLSAADHFESKQVFNNLLYNLSVEDIFWEFPKSKGERIMAARD